MLSPEEKEALRGKLEAERTRILANAERALGYSMDRDRDIVGRDSIDESVDEEMYSIEMRLHDREKKLLGKIDEALARLAAGTINECEDCGDTIGFKRLLARPVTTLCVPCKEDREASEAQVGTSAGPSTVVGGGGELPSVDEE